VSPADGTKACPIARSDGHVRCVLHIPAQSEAAVNILIVARSGRTAARIAVQRLIPALAFRVPPPLVRERTRHSWRAPTPAANGWRGARPRQYRSDRVGG